MSASDVASNPFWYAKPTAALTSRDRLSICVLAMCISPSTNLDMMGVRKPVKPSAAVPDPDVPDRAFECGQCRSLLHRSVVDHQGEHGTSCGVWEPRSPVGGSRIDRP